MVRSKKWSRTLRSFDPVRMERTTPPKKEVPLEGGVEAVARPPPDVVGGAVEVHDLLQPLKAPLAHGPEHEHDVAFPEIVINQYGPVTGGDDSAKAHTLELPERGVHRSCPGSGSTPPPAMLPGRTKYQIRPPLSGGIGSKPQ